MKTNSSYPISARTTLAVLFCLLGVGLLCLIPFIGTQAQTQTSGIINPDGTGTNLTWMGNHNSPGGNIMESTCVDTTPAASCETYVLTVNGTPADWATAGKKIQVLLTWSAGTNEYDIYIHQGNSVNGPLVTSAIQGPGLQNQVAIIDPSSAGTGTFTIHIAYDTTPTAATDHYTANITAITGCGGTGMSSPALADPNIPNGGIGYENYEAPGVLTPVVVTSSGGATVEYLGRGAGEPSTGSNWLSANPNTAVGGVANIQSDLETDFVYFANPDATAPTVPIATWFNRRAPTSVAIDSDPIGFTDHETGRVFAGELTLLSPDTPKISFTDNDGLNWSPAPFLQGPASAVDHETIGGGHYNPNSVPPPPPHPTYPNAVYYCSQDIGAAFCARSDDGGMGLGTQTPLYTLEQCGGLHGHVKVAPDGTVYVPNRSCLGGNTAVVVSTDNGISWTVRPITNALTLPSSPSTDDPAVAIDAAGTVYALFALNGTQATVAVSTTQGTTWTNIYDVGAAFGVKNVAFPAAIAGDAGRVAVAFYGSTNDGCDSSADQFSGVWHLYIAHTFDGGAHWTTTDATPVMPMQRMGLLRGGGGPVDRNLLDFFDMTVDKDGRVIVGYVNGCSGGPCSQASGSAVGNAYTTTASLMRQSSGKRLFVANDPAGSTSKPGMPFVTATRIGNVLKLGWNEADSGNQAITGYDVYRSTSSNNETLLTSIGNVNTYTDNSATDITQTYYYQVVAKNTSGQSPRRNEISVPYVGDTCSGIIIHRNLPNHPEATGGTASPPPLPQLLIDYVAVGEPPSTSQLMFKMKVGNLTTLPPNSRWRIVWDWAGSAANPNVAEQYFVGIRTDNTTPTPNVSFEYGTVATLSAVVVGVPQENLIGTPDAGSNYNPDGTITIFVPKSAVGSPQPGDLLGAVNGRTFTGDTPGTQNLERSTALIDHTFVKGNTDNSYPPATYMVAGNTICPSGSIVPVSAVSRKTHGSAGDFEVDLPLIGKPGIECRTGPVAQAHKVVVTFSAPVTVTNVTATPGAGGTITNQQPSFSVSNSQVTVNLTGVSNQQTFTINLLGVSDGTRSGDVAIPMSVLLGDVNATGRTDSGDQTLVRNNSVSIPNLSTFRMDVNCSGRIDSGDQTVVRNNSVTALP
jgi:hypothetical protein